jgi:hypothetical protein
MVWVSPEDRGLEELTWRTQDFPSAKQKDLGIKVFTPNQPQRLT